MKKTLLFTFCCVLSGASILNAQLIAYEGFDGNASGFSSPFASVDSANSLSYSNGGSLATVDGASGGVFNQTATLSTALTAATHDIVWFSFITERKSTGDDFRVDFVDSVGATQTGFTVTSQFSGSDDVQLRLVQDESTFVGTSVIGSGVGSNFFALEVNMDTGLVNAYYNPSLTTGPGAVAATFTNTQATDTGIQDIQLVFGGAYRFDEIRIGESFADVAPVPESSAYSIILGALALVFTAVRRRR